MRNLESCDALQNDNSLKALGLILRNFVTLLKMLSILRLSKLWDAQNLVKLLLRRLGILRCLRLLNLPAFKTLLFFGIQGFLRRLKISFFLTKMPITTTKLINHTVLRNSAADSQQLAHNSSFYRGVHLPWQGRFHFREGDGHEVSRTRKRPQPDSQSQRLWNFCVFTLPSSVRIKVTTRRSRFERDPNLPTGSTAGAFG